MDEQLLGPVVPGTLDALDTLEPRLCESSAFYPAHGLQGVLGMVKSPKKCGQSQVEVE